MNKQRLDVLENKKNNIQHALSIFKKENVEPDEVNPVLKRNNSSEVKQKTRISKILSRPQITLCDLLEIESVNSKTKIIDSESLEQVEIQIKYEGYIDEKRNST